MWTDNSVRWKGTWCSISTTERSMFKTEQSCFKALTSVSWQLHVNDTAVMKSNGWEVMMEINRTAQKRGSISEVAIVIGLVTNAIYRWAFNVSRDTETDTEGSAIFSQPENGDRVLTPLPRNRRSLPINRFQMEQLIGCSSRLSLWQGKSFSKKGEMRDFNKHSQVKVQWNISDLHPALTRLVGDS